MKRLQQCDRLSADSQSLGLNVIDREVELPVIMQLYFT